MDIFKIIISNAIVIAIVTTLFKFMLDKGLQKQKGIIEQDLEKLKTDLQIHITTEQEKINQKRDVYINLIKTMAIFLNNRVPDNQSEQYKQAFLYAYDIAWLWANDEVMKALSNFLQCNLDKTKGIPIDPIKEQELFAKCILEMRKDIGFKETVLDHNDYRFVNF